MNTRKFLFLIISLCIISVVQSQTPTTPPGTIVSHRPKDTGIYIGSPGLCILPDGSYLASHDEFGPKTSEFRSAKTFIFPYISSTLDLPVKCFLPKSAATNALITSFEL